MDLKVAVIILTHNCTKRVGEILYRCIDSVLNQDYSNYYIIIIDNASRDDTVKNIVNRYRSLINNKIFIYKLSRNRGWSGGNNAGVVVAKDADVLFFMNDDAILVKRNTLSVIVDTLRRFRCRALVQPLVLNPDMTIQVAGFLIDSILRNFALKFRPKSILPVHHISGVAFGACRSTIIDIGLFDENLFMYHDDLDISFRARMKGNLCIVNPEIEVIHYSSKIRNPKWFYTMQYYIVRNSIYLMFKYYSLSKALIRAMVLIILRTLGGVRRLIRKRDLMYLTAIIKGIIDSTKMLRKALEVRKIVDQ